MQSQKNHQIDDKGFIHEVDLIGVSMENCVNQMLK